MPTMPTMPAAAEAAAETEIVAVGQLPFSDIASKVGCTVTSLEVENSILSSALRSIPPAPSAMMRICVLV